jgi:hypothetical protein
MIHQPLLRFVIRIVPDPIFHLSAFGGTTATLFRQGA